MKNPLNHLATAAPRALDSLLQQQKEDANKKKNANNNSKKERTCSFDLDLSGLNLLHNDGSSSSVGDSSVGFSGGSIAEEGGSVVTFQELSEFISLNDDGGGGGLSLDNWTNGSSTSMDVGSSNGMLSTNGGGETPSPN